jgi:hypothetical protein
MSQVIRRSARLTRRALAELRGGGRGLEAGRAAGDPDDRGNLADFVDTSNASLTQYRAFARDPWFAPTRS